MNRAPVLEPVDPAETLATLDQLRARLDRYHAPTVDCYVLGCHEQPYLATRHADRPGIVLTCPAHDPWKFDRGRTVYAWYRKPTPAVDQEHQEQAETAQDAPEDDARAALRLFRAFLETAARLDQDAGSRHQDDDDQDWGTRVRRPTPPTRPTPPAGAVKPPLGF